MVGRDNINGGKRQYKWRVETIEMAGKDNRIKQWKETIEMAGRDNRNGGRTIRYLANDPNILKKTGKQMNRFIS